MRGTLDVCLSTNELRSAPLKRDYVLPHHGAIAPIDPSEKHGDDSQRLDNSNAMVRDCMNPLVLSCSHL